MTTRSRCLLACVLLLSAAPALAQTRVEEVGALLTNTDQLEGYLDGVEALLTGILGDGSGDGGGIASIEDAVYVDDDDFTDNVSKFFGVGGVRMDTPDTVTNGDWGVLRVSANHELMVAGTFTANLVDGDSDPLPDDTASALRVLVVDDTGATIVYSDAYTEDAVAPANPEGPPVMLRRDNDLSETVTTEGDWIVWPSNTRGAGWVDLDPNGTIGLAILSALVTEDLAESTGQELFGVGTVRRDTMASSAGTTGDNATLNTDGNGLLWARNADPCTGVAKQYFPFDITASGTAEITPSLSGSGNFWYICAINLVTTAANNINLVDDNTDGCGSVTASLMSSGLAAGDGWGFAANGGLAFGDGLGTVMKSVTSNSVLCLVSSASTELHGTIAAVAAP